jgi:hypothetical protein
VKSLAIGCFLGTASAFLMFLIDFYNLKNKIATVYSSTKDFLAQKTGKRGVEPLTFGFGNQRSTS